MSVVRRQVLSKDSIAIIERDKSVTFTPETSGTWQTIQSKIFNHPDGSSNNYAYAPTRIPAFFESPETFEFLGFQPAIAARMWQTYNQVDASSSEDKEKYERDCYSIAGVRLPFVQSRMIPIIASGHFSSLFDNHVVRAPSNSPDNDSNNRSTSDNNSDNDQPHSPSSSSLSSTSQMETLLTSEKIGLLPSALTAMYAIGTEFEGRLPTSATLSQISNWIGELISRRFFYLEEIDYKIKKYHGKAINRWAAAASWGPSRSGEGDWGIRGYEALRVNRALERRIVITRWMIRELEKNEDEYYDEDDDDWRGRDDSEGDNVGRERGDWRECDGYVKS